MIAEEILQNLWLVSICQLTITIKGTYFHVYQILPNRDFSNIVPFEKAMNLDLSNPTKSSLSQS